MTRNDFYFTYFDFQDSDEAYWEYNIMKKNNIRWNIARYYYSDPRILQQEKSTKISVNLSLSYTSSIQTYDVLTRQEQFIFARHKHFFWCKPLFLD